MCRCRFFLWRGNAPVNLLQLGASAITKGAQPKLSNLRTRAELTAATWAALAVAAIFILLAATTFLTAEIGLGPASLVIATIMSVIAGILLFARRVAAKRTASKQDESLHALLKALGVSPEKTPTLAGWVDALRSNRRK